MFQKALYKVLIGQSITTGPPTYRIVWRLIEVAALSKFDESALLHGSETLIHYEEVFGDIMHYVFPMRALQQIQKIYMGRHMRKAPYMKMKEYMACIEEFNILYQCSLTTLMETSYTKMNY
jgi:hypothetical protein